MNCGGNEKKRCEVKIVEQPKSCFSFIKTSAVKGSRGSITNREDDGCVKIIANVNHNSLANLKVLVTTAVQEEVDKVYIPSRYIVQKCGISEENINCDLFKGDFKAKKGEAHQFEYELENAFIFAPYENKNSKYPHLEKAAVLQKSYRAYLEFKSIKKSDDEIHKLCDDSCKEKYAKKTCLAFDVYTEDPVTGTRDFVTDTIYSDTIYDGKQEFVVRKLCNPHVLNDGNSEMTILLSDVKGVKVKFVGPNEKNMQEISVSHTLCDNLAIVIDVPKIECDTNKIALPYALKIENAAGVEAKAVPFYYVNTEFELNDAKRKITSRGENEDNGYIGSNREVSSPGPKFVTLLALLKKIGATNPENPSTDYTKKFLELVIKLGVPLVLVGGFFSYFNLRQSRLPSYDICLYFEAVRSKQFKKLIRDSPKECHEAMANARNNLQQTLLHYACELNRYEYIKDIVEIGCPVAAHCLYNYQTALHIAIERRYIGCINEFIKIMKNKPYPNEDIVAMLKHHDKRGYTVAHAAAENGLVRLMRAILRYFRSSREDILDSKILSLQFSLFDLAEKAGHKEMLELLITERYQLEEGDQEDEGDQAEVADNVESDDDEMEEINTSNVQNNKVVHSGPSVKSVVLGVFNIFAMMYGENYSRQNNSDTTDRNDYGITRYEYK